MHIHAKNFPSNKNRTKRMLAETPTSKVLPPVPTRACESTKTHRTTLKKVWWTSASQLLFPTSLDRAPPAPAKRWPRLEYVRDYNAWFGQGMEHVKRKTFLSFLLNCLMILMSWHQIAPYITNGNARIFLQTIFQILSPKVTPFALHVLQNTF